MSSAQSPEERLALLGGELGALDRPAALQHADQWFARLTPHLRRQVRIGCGAGADQSPQDRGSYARLDEPPHCLEGST
jgi:hypothetical protein